MLCNSDFSERLGGWESVIWVLSAKGPSSGYRTIHDFTVQRGRSPLGISNHPRYHGSAWKVLLGISNHPRYHGSAWKVPLGISNHPRFHGSARKVPALDIEPSTISWFSVEGPARNIEPSTISRFSVEGPRPEAVTKRAERANGGARAACFEQPEGVYSGCVDARPAKYTSSYSVSTHPGYEA